MSPLLTGLREARPLSLALNPAFALLRLYFRVYNGSLLFIKHPLHIFPFFPPENRLLSLQCFQPSHSTFFLKHTVEQVEDGINNQPSRNDRIKAPRHRSRGAGPVTQRKLQTSLTDLTSRLAIGPQITAEAWQFLQRAMDASLIHLRSHRCRGATYEGYAAPTVRFAQCKLAKPFGYTELATACSSQTIKDCDIGRIYKKLYRGLEETNPALPRPPHPRDLARRFAKAMGLDDRVTGLCTTVAERAHEDNAVTTGGRPQTVAAGAI